MKRKWNRMTAKAADTNKNANALEDSSFNTDDIYPAMLKEGVIHVVRFQGSILLCFFSEDENGKLY